MLSLIKRIFLSPPAAEQSVASQPPGVPFPWPRGARLTALELVTIAIPAAAIAPDEKIGSVILGDPDMQIQLPATPSDSLIYLRLKEGCSVQLSKSVQGVVISEDKAPKRIRVRPPQNENA